MRNNDYGEYSTAAGDGSGCFDVSLVMLLLLLSSVLSSTAVTKDDRSFIVLAVVSVLEVFRFVDGFALLVLVLVHSLGRLYCLFHTLCLLEVALSHLLLFGTSLYYFWSLSVV